MSTLTIDSIQATGNELECHVTASGGLERFFGREPFRATYDCSIETVPDGILVVPALAQALPVAWARGATVETPVVDARFAEAVETVQSSLVEMHDFIEGGRLDASYESYSPPESGDCGLLFTGGVDSTASYVTHRDEEPTLVSIRGWTITPEPADDEKWNALRARVTDFANERDLETAFVESNMLRFLDHPMLLAHYKRFVDGAWYSSVGHGLGLTGLCAPLAYARGMENLYVAATHWDGIDLAWGSHPSIDDNVAWSGTRCHHDGYEYTRQQRLDRIATYVQESNRELTLQTCNDRMDGNCSRCEKCYRTAIGLRLSGLDPADLGYRFADADYRAVRAAFEDGRWVLGEDERYMWADIRNRARETDPRSPAERRFFAWLDDVDLDELVAGATPPLHHRCLRAGARVAPTPLYRRLYPLWRGVSTLGQRLPPNR